MTAITAAPGTDVLPVTPPLDMQLVDRCLVIRCGDVPGGLSEQQVDRIERAVRAEMIRIKHDHRRRYGVSS
jgi:hypothetical protein